jgi:hypothetical protein
MSTVTTLRPSATSSGIGWGAEPSGTLDEVTSDNSDSTYAEWSGDGSPLILGTPVDSPPAGERRHLVRIRARGEDGTAWWAVRLASGGLVAGAAATFTASPSTVSGSWQAGVPADGPTILSTYVTGQSPAVKINELYIDVDSREAPTFTPLILDASGASTVTVSDTNTPTIRAGSVDLDDLHGRQYRYWVTLSGVTVWDTGVVSGASSDQVTSPLGNGSYVAHLQIWSTLGANTAYASDEETLSFTVSVGTVPEPDPPVVTPAEPFYLVEVCAPDTDDFDDGVAWIEIQRVDCEGETTTIAVVGPLETGYCEEWADWTLPRSGMGRSCTHDPEPCCSVYRVRTVGRVDGALLVSAWSDTSGSDEYCLEWSDDEHLIRSTGPDGPIWAPIWGKFEWDVTRPFTAAAGVNGTRFVTSAPPGGRNLRMQAAVESEADLATLRAVLARPLVLISPSDASEVWAAPIAESVRVVKVGRIRAVTATFIGTGPEPAPQLADVGV